MLNYDLTSRETSSSVFGSSVKSCLFFLCWRHSLNLSGTYPVIAKNPIETISIATPDHSSAFWKAKLSTRTPPVGGPEMLPAKSAKLKIAINTKIKFFFKYHSNLPAASKDIIASLWLTCVLSTAFLICGSAGTQTNENPQAAKHPPI